MCIEIMCCGEVGQSVQNGKGQRVTGTSVSQRSLHGKAVGIEWARTGVRGQGRTGQEVGHYTSSVYIID